MSADDDLERLKARRLAEMQKNLSTKQPKPAEPEKRQSARDLLVSRLGYRGLEVLELAESQYPVQTRAITAKIAELILQGGIDQAIDGGDLLALFRSVGLPVRVKTTISVEQDGKLVSLSERLRAYKE